MRGLFLVLSSPFPPLLAWHGHFSSKRRFSPSPLPPSKKSEEGGPPRTWHVGHCKSQEVTFITRVSTAVPHDFVAPRALRVLRVVMTRLRAVAALRARGLRTVAAWRASCSISRARRLAPPGPWLGHRENAILSDTCYPLPRRVAFSTAGAGAACVRSQLGFRARCSTFMTRVYHPTLTAWPTRGRQGDRI